MRRLYIKSVTLVELLIAVTLISLVALGFSSLDIFSRYHVISADRRSKLQNELSYALEDVHKNLLYGTGNYDNPPLVQLIDGFKVRVDNNSVQTPQDFSDDTWVSYTLSGNQFSSSASGVLASHILSGVEFTATPSNPASGLYILFSNNNTVVEVGLVARWKPGEAQSIDNPQAAMKSRIYTRNSAAK